MTWSRAITLMQDLASKREVLNRTFITDPRLFTNKRGTPSTLTYCVTYSYFEHREKKKNVSEILFLPTRVRAGTQGQLVFEEGDADGAAQTLTR